MDGRNREGTPVPWPSLYGADEFPVCAPGGARQRNVPGAWSQPGPFLPVRETLFHPTHRWPALHRDYGMAWESNPPQPVLHCLPLILKTRAPTGTHAIPSVPSHYSRLAVFGVCGVKALPAGRVLRTAPASWRGIHPRPRIGIDLLRMCQMPNSGLPEMADRLTPCVLALSDPVQVRMEPHRQPVPSAAIPMGQAKVRRAFVIRSGQDIRTFRDGRNFHPIGRIVPVRLAHVPPEGPYGCNGPVKLWCILPSVTQKHAVHVGIIKDSAIRLAGQGVKVGPQTIQQILDAGFPDTELHHVREVSGRIFPGQPYPQIHDMAHIVHTCAWCHERYGMQLPGHSDPWEYTGKRSQPEVLLQGIGSRKGMDLAPDPWNLPRREHDFQFQCSRHVNIPGPVLHVDPLQRGQMFIGRGGLHDSLQAGAVPVCPGQHPAGSHEHPA